MKRSKGSVEHTLMLMRNISLEMAEAVHHGMEKKAGIQVRHVPLEEIDYWASTIYQHSNGLLRDLDTWEGYFQDDDDASDD